LGICLQDFCEWRRNLAKANPSLFEGVLLRITQRSRKSRRT
jgi:hypothetical protein